MDINYYKKFEPIDGKWYLTKELGSGSFGRVFEIERRDFTHDKSALKIVTIPSSPAEVSTYREENFDLDEQSITSYFYGFVEEFTKEFALMTELKGQKNIVRIEDYDVKKHEGTIGWDIFIRMELLTPLSKHYAQNPPTAADVVRLGIDICRALEVCQKFQIVHRDIKPSNIFVSDDGEFKLGDFGVARTLEKTSSGLSKKGTYTYMAPEVYKGENYSSNVDIYSLGIVMYKLLNNNMEPFKKGRTHEDEENALLSRLRGEKMPKPANADGKLGDIILKACEYDPNNRYRDAAKFREDLEDFLSGQQNVQPVFVNAEPSAFIPNVVPEEEDDATVGIFDAAPAKEAPQSFASAQATATTAPEAPVTPVQEASSVKPIYVASQTPITPAQEAPSVKPIYVAPETPVSPVQEAPSVKPIYVAPQTHTQQTPPVQPVYVASQTPPAQATSQQAYTNPQGNPVPSTSGQQQFDQFINSTTNKAKGLFGKLVDSLEKFFAKNNVAPKNAGLWILIGSGAVLLFAFMLFLAALGSL